MRAPKAYTAEMLVHLFAENLRKKGPKGINAFLNDWSRTELWSKQWLKSGGVPIIALAREVKRIKHEGI